MMEHVGCTQTISTPRCRLNGGCNRYPPRIRKALSKNTTNTKSSITCKYWINGNCMYGDKCRNLHSWPVSVSEGTSMNMEKIMKGNNTRVKRLIWWTRPLEGFVKINCDGAVTVHGNKAGAGGVVRDCEGKFMFGFSSGLRSSSVLIAELKAIKIGIETALSKGYKNLMVESDSKAAIEIITSIVAQGSNTGATLDVISSIIEMSKLANNICWNHVFREVNSAADGLAKQGLSLCPDLGVQLFYYPPYFIQSNLSLDRAGKTYLR